MRARGGLLGSRGTGVRFSIFGLKEAIALFGPAFDQLAVTQPPEAPPGSEHAHAASITVAT
jgi:hypothetical protein